MRRSGSLTQKAIKVSTTALQEGGVDYYHTPKGVRQEGWCPLLCLLRLHLSSTGSGGSGDDDEENGLGDGWLDCISDKGKGELKGTVGCEGQERWRDDFL